MVYLNEDAFDMRNIVDPKGIQEVVICPQFEKSKHTMN